MKNKNIKKIVDKFNKEFKTKLKVGNINLLVDIFNEYVSFNISDSLGNLKVKEILEVEEEIIETFSKDELELFKKFNDLKEKYYDDEIEKTFVYGACFYKELEKELNLEELE